MREKKKHLLPALLLGILLALALGCTVQAATVKWVESNNPYEKTTKSGDRYFVEGSSISRTVKGKTSKLAVWKLNGNQMLNISHANGNKLYVNVRPVGSRTAVGPLYSVDIKTGKKTKVLSSFRVLTASGAWIYGYKTDVMTPGSHPIQIWKISGNRVKAVGKLDESVEEVRISKGKLYTSSSSGDEFCVYRSSMKGTGRKKLFSIKPGPGGYGWIYEVTASSVIVGSTSADGVTTQYTWDLKTGKLTEKAMN